jgi:thioredoxin-like negative regulator of GroEL
MEYESQSNGEVKVIIIDVDTNGRLTQQYGVRVIPHSFLLLNGEVIDDRIGSMDGDDLKKWLESNESSWKKPRIVAALD